VVWCGVDWIGLTQDMENWKVLVKAVMKFRVPQNVGKLTSGYTTDGLSSSSRLHSQFVC
jgi:hypothetical protein